MNSKRGTSSTCVFLTLSFIVVDSVLSGEDHFNCSDSQVSSVLENLLNGYRNSDKNVIEKRGDVKMHHSFME